MDVCIVGNGKLAHSLLAGLKEQYGPTPWESFDAGSDRRAVIVHVGSGRQLGECVDYCNRTDSVLLELSTGGDIEQHDIACPVIVCPNTAMPIVKMMHVLKKSGHLFSEYTVRIAESHQRSKTTVAGTAVELAKALGSDAAQIDSVRDVGKQMELGIPEAHLDLHAYHEIVVEDAGCEVAIRLKVLGHDAYVRGVAVLLDMIAHRDFECGIHDVVDIVAGE